MFLVCRLPCFTAQVEKISHGSASGINHGNLFESSTFSLLHSIWFSYCILKIFQQNQHSRSWKSFAPQASSSCFFLTLQCLQLWFSVVVGGQSMTNHLGLIAFLFNLLHLFIFFSNFPLFFWFPNLLCLLFFHFVECLTLIKFLLFELFTFCLEFI